MRIFSDVMTRIWGPRYPVAPIPDEADRLLEYIRPMSAHDAVKTLSVKAEHIDTASINLQELATSAKSQLELARYYLAQTEDKVHFSFRQKLHEFIDNVLFVIDSIISTFNISLLFSSSDDKLYKITALLSAFGMFVPMLFQIVEPHIAHAILTGMCLLALAATFIYPHFSLKPTALPYGENYTQKFHSGDLPIERGREIYIEKMAAILSREKRPKHVLLYGQPGIGKNELAKSFVQAIETKKLPQFAGKTVFYISCAEFVKMESPSAGNPFKDILQAMNRHKEGFVLILDEIHTIATGKAKEIASKLLSYLNSGSDGFSHVIAITTEEKLKKMKKANEAFCDRFEPIKIENTSKDETVSILDRALLHQRTRPFLEKGAETIQELYEKVSKAFPQRAQPATSIKILKACIDKTSKTQKIALEQEIVKRQQALDASLASRTLNQISGIGTPSANDGLEVDLATLHSKLDEHRSALESLFRTKELLDAVQSKLYRTIVKTQSVANLKKFTFFSSFSHYLQRALVEEARLAEQKYQIKTTIGSQLIDEAIQEEAAAL